MTKLNNLWKKALPLIAGGAIIISLGDSLHGKAYNFIKEKIENTKESKCKPLFDPIYKKAIIVNPYNEKRKIKRSIEKISQDKYLSNMIFETKDIKDNTYYRFKILSKNKDSLKDLINNLQYGDTLKIEVGKKQYGCKDNGKIDSNLEYYEEFNWYLGELEKNKIKCISKNIITK